MHQDSTVLLKFTIPELEPLPRHEQERVLAACWESPAVQAAWRRFLSRPHQVPAIPVAPIAIYAAIANIGLLWVVLLSFPIGIIGFIGVRRHYSRKLIATLREAAASQLAGTSPKHL